MTQPKRSALGFLCSSAALLAPALKPTCRSCLQFALVPELGSAGLLVATDSALLAGYTNSASLERSTSLNLEHMQAYAITARVRGRERERGRKRNDGPPAACRAADAHALISPSSSRLPVAVQDPSLFSASSRLKPAAAAGFPWMDIVNGKLTPAASSMAPVNEKPAAPSSSKGLKAGDAAAAAAAAKLPGGKLYKILRPFKFQVDRGFDRERARAPSAPVS